HEINTPLGIANTANGMIVSLVQQVTRTTPGPQLNELLADLQESSALLTKNLERTSRLVRSFKQLSASQLSDERMTTDVGVIVRDCTETMTVETRKRNLKIRTNWLENAQFPWVGFPGHLAQVLVNLIQNTIKYAYSQEGPGGEVDVRLTKDGGMYRLEF